MIMYNINHQDLLGLSAGTLTTIAFIPQLIKTWQTKSAKDVSFAMFLLFMLGVLLWGIYGLQIHSIPVIIANTLTFILASFIIILKISFELVDKTDTIKVTTD